MHIRHETESDRPHIYAVHASAFDTSTEARLVDQLRADGDLILSLVAEKDGAIVGHVAFSRMAAPFRALGLAPVAVLPEHQSRGTGAALIREGLERARQQGWEGVFVLGDAAYYQRFGFDAALAAGFVCRYAGAHFMALAPGGETLPQLHGPIAYAPAFDALE